MCDDKLRLKTATGLTPTPEMVSAGVAAFLDFDSRFESEEDAVLAIYEEMEKVREAERVRAGCPASP